MNQYHNKWHKKVSIVMGTYNGEEYLRKQLETILNQDYPIYEIIIQDDYSNDNTWQILQEYEKKYSLIKISQNKSNIGYTLNFLTAAKKAKGDYIAYADQDDLWMPNKVSTMIETIVDKKMVISQSEIFDETSKTSFPSYNRNNPSSLTISKILITSNSYSGNQILFDRSLLNYFDIALKHSFDHVLTVFYCGLLMNSVAISDQVLQIWRRHENTVTKCCPIKRKETFYKHIKGYKTYICLYSLIFKRRSRFIYNSFNIRYNFLFDLSKMLNFEDKHNKLLELMVLMKEQKFLGYFRASLICYSLRKEIFGKNKFTLKESLSVLTHVYRHWYDFQHCYW